MAFSRPWCSRSRQLGPLLLNTMALCLSRSGTAAVTTVSPKMVPQSGNPRFVVTMVGWPLLVAGVDDLEENGEPLPRSSPVFRLYVPLPPLAQ